MLCDLGSTKTSGAILTFVKTAAHPEGAARVLHNVREYRGPGPHRKSVFACVGDVHKFDIDVVKFDTDILALAAAVSIHKDVGTHFTNLGAVAADQPKMIGPFDHNADAARYEHDCTRNSMFLPASLVPFVIGDDEMPASKAAEVRFGV